ncbi:DHA2 family lincomycin resistance protein-like MFS transporter [Isoptericola sp. CG 20/1183]|uniref:DHA2 family lincomycin resistance protein-like MFS transporter n=1 Tax=Isoptericola halotolerans TaxID=300560 RepID=A0ABX5EHB3_9MICO|nr:MULTISPECIES: DHA2 family efflux MFS transporter permease subunit [Isoptericola]PRZ08812.1 DHA2 family lincomycin resistance protein-like MFS transporter [Isoptericola halotolerans]PRZ10741.1 DHA2 family lincomycin resistance protein-like MFS transporter [Isoptericola sp. CG 20/1183]
MSVRTTEAPPGPTPTDGDRLPREHVRVIALLLVSAFVVILNETTMGVALPAVMEEFDIPESSGQWLTTGFLLTMAVVIPSTGWLLQRLGTRGAFILAMSLFTTGTFLAAIAPVFGLLVAARVVQASGTAIMMPLLMTTVMSTVPPHRRGRVMGNVSLVIAVAPALGPTVSGGVVTALGWREVFWVVLPIAAVSLLLGSLLVRDVADRARTRLDPLSLLLAAVAFGGLVYGLSALGEAAQHDLPLSPAVPLVAGAVFLGLFVWRQLVLQRTDSALLDLRVFRAPGFSVGLSVMAVSMIAMFGMIIGLPLVLQRGMGLDALTAGLLMLPGGLLMGLLGPVVGRLYDRVGPRPLAIPGVAAVGVAMLLFASLSPTSPLWLVVVGHLVLSLGLAFIFTPTFTSALGGLRPGLYSHGSAAITTVQQLAGAAGTAMFVALLTLRKVTLLDAGATEAEATAGGAQLAFTVAAVVIVGALVLATRLRKSEAPQPAPAH